MRVSLVCFSRNDDRAVQALRLDGVAVDEIHADLTARRGGVGVDLTDARCLAVNARASFKGDEKGGPFNVPGDLARDWLRLPANPNGRTNADVLKPWINGMDVTRRPADKWIVDVSRPDHPIGGSVFVTVPLAGKLTETMCAWS